MTKAELITAIAEKAGIDKKDAQKALDGFVSCITEAMKRREAVRIVGFGNFVSMERPAGTARNPATGAAVNRPASHVIRFRAGDTLKAAVQ